LGAGAAAFLGALGALGALAFFSLGAAAFFSLGFLASAFLVAFLTAVAFLGAAFYKVDRR
jgi:hypothetical protein